MAPKNCDVLVIGAGLSGCTFARTVHDAGADVVMIDAGNYHSPRAGWNCKNSWISQRDLLQFGHFVRSQLHAPSDTTSPDYPGALVSHAVGGMAVHWTCAIPRFHPQVERPAMIDDAEWNALYPAAERLLNRNDDVFDHSIRHRAIRSALTQRDWTVLPTPMAAKRSSGTSLVSYTGADTILGTLANPGRQKGFRIVPGHIVRRLITGPQGRIVGVEMLDTATADVFTVEAGHVVVAAGWLYNAQLLWASGINAGEDGALGRYFTDHTFANATVMLKSDLLAAYGDGRLPDDDAAPHLYLPLSDDRPWQGMIFRESYQFAPDSDDAERLLGIDLKWFGVIAPDRENRVQFLPDRLDRLGMPTPVFHLRLGADDQSIAEHMMQDMRSVAAVLGPYRPGGEPGFAPLGAAIHGAGLTRMGAADDDGRTSVVDPVSRVWGYDNLQVAGTSVIPTGFAANPTLTAIALALKGARYLAGCQQTKKPNNVNLG